MALRVNRDAIHSLEKSFFIPRPNKSNSSKKEETQTNFIQTKDQRMSSIVAAGPRAVTSF